jgi:hypothetical protein
MRGAVVVGANGIAAVGAAEVEVVATSSRVARDCRARVRRSCPCDGGAKRTTTWRPKSAALWHRLSPKKTWPLQNEMFMSGALRSLPTCCPGFKQASVCDGGGADQDGDVK